MSNPKPQVTVDRRAPIIAIGVGLVLVAAGFAAAFTVVGAFLIAAGLGLVIGGIVRTVGLSIIVSWVVGVIVLAGLSVWMMIDLGQRD